MEDFREIEQFSALWTLAGRPILISAAERSADLFLSGERAGLTIEQIMCGLDMARGHGKQTPSYGDLNRLIVYQKVMAMAQVSQSGVRDENWMPREAFKPTADGESGVGWYRSTMAEFAPHIVAMHTDLRSRIEREYPGYLASLGDPITHPSIQATLRCNLLNLARRFRSAIEEIMATQSVHPTLQDFPAGSCAICTNMLGDHLNTLGFGMFYFASGERGESVHDQEDHAWLEVDGLIVDITADQFEGENRSSVYVDKPDDWYQAWDTELGIKRVAYLDGPHAGAHRSLLQQVLEVVSKEPG